MVAVTSNYCKLLKKAIMSEHDAIKMYKKLADMAPTRRVKRIHMRIRRDEMSHNRVDTRLYHKWCK